MAIIVKSEQDKTIEWCPKCERKAGRFPFITRLEVTFCKKCGLRKELT